MAHDRHSDPYDGDIHLWEVRRTVPETFILLCCVRKIKYMYVTSVVCYSCVMQHFLLIQKQI